MLRFVAAAMVVICHLPTLLAAAVGQVESAGLRNATDIGAAGVDVFFVLSGFVIATTGALASPRPTGAIFFWKRWSRVAPFYFVISAIPLGQAALAGTVSGAKVIATFLFWPVTGNAISEPYLEVGWTLSFEMAFYTAMSLVLAGGNLRRNLAIGAGGCAALVMWRLSSRWAGLQFLLHPLFLEFGAGVLLAALRGRLWRLSPRLGATIMGLGFALLVVQIFVGPHGVGTSNAPFCGSDLRRVVVFGGPAAMIVCGVIGLEPICTGALSRYFAKLGDASYAIYLVQFFALFQVAALWRALHLGPSPWPLLLASVIGATLAGVFVHWVIERPIMRDMKRLRLVRARPSLASAGQGEGAA